MDDYEILLAEEAASRRSHLETAAHAALSAFVTDHQRIRTIRLEGDLLAFVITSKTTVNAPRTPVVHAGVEPAATIERSADDVLVHEGGRAVTVATARLALTHTCWVVRVGQGRLVRTWRNNRDGHPNTAERFYAVKRDGLVKEVNAIEYRRLRAALNRSLALRERPV